MSIPNEALQKVKIYLGPLAPVDLVDELFSSPSRSSLKPIPLRGISVSSKQL